MKSPLCQWINDLADLAEKENVIIEGRYIDFLEYAFAIRMPLHESLSLYKQTVERIKAIENIKNKLD